MLKETEFFHGVVFARLVRDIGIPIEIAEIPDAGTSAYLLQGRIAIYIKYSTKRLSPWGFTFSREHLRELSQLRKSFPGFIMALVCHEDGIAALSSGDTNLILGDDSNVNRNLSVTIHRHAREQYAVNGSMGQLPRKVSEKALGNLVRHAIASGTTI